MCSNLNVSPCIDRKAVGSYLGQREELVGRMLVWLVGWWLGCLLFGGLVCWLVGVLVDS